MKSGSLLSLFTVVLLIPALRASSANACSRILPDLRFFQSEAPAGGVWWVHRSLHPFDGFDGGTPQLVDDEGNARPAEVVSSGPLSSLVIRVPADAPVGSEWQLHNLNEEPPSDGRPPLRVIAGPPPPEAPPTLGPLSTDIVEVIGARNGVFAVPNPFESTCEDGLLFSLHDETLIQGVRVLVSTETPDEVLVDVFRGPAGEPFDPLLRGVVDAFVPDRDVLARELTFGRREDERQGPFDVHVRLRSRSSGLASNVQTITIDVPLDSRTQLACSCHATHAPSGTTPPLAAAPVLLLALFSRRRR